MAQIVLETGIKKYDIVDENGVSRGTISFNPSDQNFIANFTSLEKFMLDMANKIELDEEDADGVVEKVIQYDEQVKQKINEVFKDDNASNVIFGGQHCLTTINGVSHIERFITNIMPIVKKDVEEQHKLQEQHIKKYASKIRK